MDTSPVEFVDASRAASIVARGAAVLDARDAASFAHGHVPGARLYSWQTMTGNGTLRGRLVPDVRELGRSVASLGVDHDRPVLVYGNSVRGWGEEGHAAWLLALLGHRDVTILGG